MTEEKKFPVPRKLRNTAKQSMNVAILTGCESDRHLSEQIFQELLILGIQAIFIQLSQNNIIDSYHKADYYFKSYKYDLVLAVGDRIEQIGGVLAAFQRKIFIGHLYSGDLNTGVSDDIHRSAITLYSNIQFCSCMESTENTIRLMRSAGLVPDANYVGATHFNGKNIEEIKANEYGLHTYKPYILILINSENKENDQKLIEETLSKLEYFFPDKHICKFRFNIAKGNNDNEDIETKLFTEIMKKTDGDINIVRDNRQNHDFFLSLIANSYMFITNSSAATYEAPMLLNQANIVHIGNRNKERTKISDLAHDGLASKRVANLIKTFLEART